MLGTIFAEGYDNFGVQFRALGGPGGGGGGVRYTGSGAAKFAG